MIVKDLIKILSGYPQDIEVKVKKLDYEYDDGYQTFKFPPLENNTSIKYYYESSHPHEKTTVINDITEKLLFRKFRITRVHQIELYKQWIQTEKQHIIETESNDDLSNSGKEKKIKECNESINRYSEILEYLESDEFKAQLEMEFSEAKPVLIFDPAE